MISAKLAENFGVTDNLQFIISAVVAALTVGGKAIGKEIAAKNSTTIIYGLRKSHGSYKRGKQIIKIGGKPMCGIVGFYSEEKNKEQTIKKMADRIKHRGPDGEGVYVDEKVALGHRRLSIIDLEGGSQPMYTEDKKLVVVFNGEIYNYIDLREELKEKGYEFKTNCDTEVLLHGYREWKEEMPKKLRGMFAFALWDKEEDTLFCARDHFGIKPLYYYKKKSTPGEIAFASEIKAFLEYPEFEKEVNKKLIGPYLSFSFTPTNETLFEDVYRLLPGTYMKVTGRKNRYKRIL